jgi:hypothetical protein
MMTLLQAAPDLGARRAEPKSRVEPKSLAERKSRAETK